MYQCGYVFTRLGRGVMHQTRSIRIDLNKFKLSSENRRILRKTKNISLSIHELPLENYDWNIGKMAKDFYETKFGKGVMSAQKIKEILTNKEKSNFNIIIVTEQNMPEKGTCRRVLAPHSFSAAFAASEGPFPGMFCSVTCGYAICYKNSSILHYSYPFYDIEKSPKDMGLSMILQAIQYAKDANMKYIYLGSLQRPTDTYKLQFSGLEWFDGQKWNTDIEAVKKFLRACSKSNA